MIFDLYKSKGYAANEIIDILKDSGFSDITLSDIKHITDKTKQRKKKNTNDNKNIIP